MLLIISVIAIVVLALRFKALDTLFEFVVSVSTFRSNIRLAANVVHVNGSFADRCVALVISLLQHR